MVAVATQNWWLDRAIVADANSNSPGQGTAGRRFNGGTGSLYVRHRDLPCPVGSLPRIGRYSSSWRDGPEIIAHGGTEKTCVGGSVPPPYLLDEWTNAARREREGLLGRLFRNRPHDDMRKERPGRIDGDTSAPGRRTHDSI